jgi:glycosyltransferase EpsD
MLNRNPMVATVNRGHRELVTEGENGYLVQPGDTARMAEAVISILNDPREAERLGGRGYEMVQPYTVPVVQEELKRIYFDV